MHVKYNIHDVMGGMGIDMKDGMNKFETKHFRGKVPVDFGCNSFLKQLT